MRSRLSPPLALVFLALASAPARGAAPAAAFPDRFGPLAAAIAKESWPGRKPTIDRTLSAQALALRALEARRHFARADALDKAAMSDAERRKALDEYAAGIRVAPWFPDGYLEAALICVDLQDPASALALLRAYEVVGHDPVLLADARAAVRYLQGAGTGDGALGALREKLRKPSPPAAKSRPDRKKKRAAPPSAQAFWGDQAWDAATSLPLPAPISIASADSGLKPMRTSTPPPEAMRRLAGDWTVVRSEFPDYADQVKISVEDNELVVRYKIGGAWFELVTARFFEEPPYAQWEYRYDEKGTAEFFTPTISPGQSEIAFDLLLMNLERNTFYTYGERERWTLTRWR